MTEEWRLDSRNLVDREMEKCDILRSSEAIQLRAIEIRFLISRLMDSVLWMSTPKYVSYSTISTLFPATGASAGGKMSIVWILVLNQLTWRPRSLASWFVVPSANTSADSISVRKATSSAVDRLKTARSGERFGHNNRHWAIHWA